MTLLQPQHSQKFNDKAILREIKSINQFGNTPKNSLIQPQKAKNESVIMRS